MKKYKFKQYVLASALVLTALTSCNVPEDNNELISFVPEEVTNPETITQHIIARDDLSLLEAAMRELESSSDFKVLTDLNVPGNSTFFASSNQVIRDILAGANADNVSELPESELLDLVQNNLIVGKFNSSELVPGYLKTAVTKEFSYLENDFEVNLNMFVNNDEEGISLNRDTRIITADIEANNGVLHIIDNSLGTPSMASLMGVNPSLSGYLDAARHADNLIQDDGNIAGAERFLRRSAANKNITVFVPTNEAFNAYLDEIGAVGETLSERIETLDQNEILKIVRYHQLSVTIPSDSLPNSSLSTRFPDSNIVINKDARTITDERGGVANISATLIDIHGGNGVLHVIDKVLLPTEESLNREE